MKKVIVFLLLLLSLQVFASQVNSVYMGTIECEDVFDHDMKRFVRVLVDESVVTIRFENSFVKYSMAEVDKLIKSLTDLSMFMKKASEKQWIISFNKSSSIIANDTGLINLTVNYDNAHSKLSLSMYIKLLKANNGRPGVSNSMLALKLEDLNKIIEMLNKCKELNSEINRQIEEVNSIF